MKSSSEFSNESVTTSSGDTLYLADKMDDGKEGAVYRVKGSNEVVKVFKSDRRGDIEFEKKIRVMIDKPPTEDRSKKRNHRWFAWPTDVVYYHNEFIGYVMPLINTDDFVPLRTQILDEFSKDSGLTEEKIKLAFNLAVVVELVHEEGHAVGDFNYQNILINQNRVTMIDCDAYSIRSEDGTEFHGSTMFDKTIPPEKRPDEDIRRTQRADNFNLAVWIFRIFTRNLQPFQAKGKLATKGAQVKMTEKNPFPFWNPSDGLIEPTTGKDNYDNLPPELRLLFESAFLGGKYHTYKRPSAGVWKVVLQRLYRQHVGGDLGEGLSRKYTGSITKGIEPGPAMDNAWLRQSRQNNRADSIDSISPSDKKVTVIGKVVAVDELTEFTNNGQTGFVTNVEIEDDTGRTNVAFWDKQGVVAARSLHPGLTAKITGRVKDAPEWKGFDEEIHVNGYESYIIEPHVDNCGLSIDQLTQRTSNLHVRGKIVAKGELRKIQSNRSGQVLNLVIADESGHVRVALWDTVADKMKSIPLGLSLEIVDGRVGHDEGELVINIEDDQIPPVVSDINTEYELVNDNIGSLNEGNIVDIHGYVSDVGTASTYDGGQYRHVNIEDGSGEIKITMWDEYADYDIPIDAEIFLTAIEVDSTSESVKTGSTTIRSMVTIFE